ARFDDYLPCRHIDGVDEIAHRLQVAGDLADDELIGALIDDDAGAWRGHLAQQPRDVRSARIREFETDRAERDVQPLLLAEPAARFRFFRQTRRSADAHDVAFEHIRERVLTED